MSHKLLRRRDVQAKVGMACATLYRRIAEGNFPAPIKIDGHTARWLESDVDAWIDRHIAATRAAAGAQAPQLEQQAA